MKPLRLEFCGINSFSERAEVDFSDLLQFGIFGIFGDTGSGKSTILDCIGFALYGNVFRLGQRSSSIADIINYKLDKAYVNYDFEIVFEGRRRTFRVEREVKRKNAVQSARVYERTAEGALVAMCDGVRESNALLERIVGLEQKDFEKCIALPQGEFAQFVKAARGDRLKLVSRLFDLEAYGEALTKRAGAHYHAAKGEAEVLAARLDPYREITKAAIEQCKQEISSLEEEEKKAVAQLAEAREREKSLTALAERKAAAERAAEAFARLQAKSGEMKALEGELSRLDRAGAVVALADEGRIAAHRNEAAQRTLAERKERFERALAAERELPPFDEEKADEEIAALTEQAARAADLEERKKRREETQRALDAVTADFRDEAGRFPEFSYEDERAAIEMRLQKLGEGDFLSFANANGKAELFREEYGTFAGELEALTGKYPIIAADSVPLIEKYSGLARGAKRDLAALRQAYEEREKLRADAQKALVELETYRGKYALHNQRLQQLQTEFKRLKEQLAACGEAPAEDVSYAGLQRSLEEKKREKKRIAEAKRQAERARGDAEVALASAQASAEAAHESLEEAKRRFREACEKNGFGSAAEARALVEKYGDAGEAHSRLEAYRREYAAAEARTREYSAEDFSAAEGDAPAEACRALAEAEEREKELVKTLALRRDALARAEKDYETKRSLEKAYSEKQAEADVAERLKRLLEGNKFMEFVAEECLQNVAANASARLLTLTGGRYFLRYDSGFVVGDNFNGGATRGVYTLSGGETFLVSLSLALALSAEICLKSLRPIEFFFLDEGFGTLDEHLVDVVLDSLEKLKNQHFSIGIISHVEELKHRIDKKLLVKKATEKHGSQITAE